MADKIKVGIIALRRYLAEHMAGYKALPDRVTVEASAISTR